MRKSVVALSLVPSVALAEVPGPVLDLLDTASADVAIVCGAVLSGIVLHWAYGAIKGALSLGDSAVSPGYDTRHLKGGGRSGY